MALLVSGIALGEVCAGRLAQARDRLEGLAALLDGRDNYMRAWTLLYLSHARRLLGDEAAETAALEAQALGEALDNRLLAGEARLRLGRLAAARGDSRIAREHALAALDGCAEGGHLAYVPGCLDALAEATAGIGAREDAVRLLAAAERARMEIEMVRVPPETEHWAAIDRGLREALGDDGYEAAWAEGYAMSMKDAAGWALRARGPRGRPPGGWDSLTPTEAQGRRPRGRRPDEPTDRRAHVHCPGDGEDPRGPCVQEARRPLASGAQRRCGDAGDRILNPVSRGRCAPRQRSTFAVPLGSRLLCPMRPDRSPSGTWGDAGDAPGTHRRHRGFGWGPGGRWFKSSRPD